MSSGGVRNYSLSRPSSAPAGASRPKENAPEEQPFVSLLRSGPKRSLQQSTPAGGGLQAGRVAGDEAEGGLFGMFGGPSRPSFQVSALPSSLFHTTHGLTAEPSGGFVGHVNQAKALSGQGQKGGPSAGAGLQAVRNMRAAASVNEGRGLNRLTFDDFLKGNPISSKNKLENQKLIDAAITGQRLWRGRQARKLISRAETPVLSAAPAPAAMAPSTSGAWAPQNHSSGYDGSGYYSGSERRTASDGDDEGGSDSGYSGYGDNFSGSFVWGPEDL